MQFKEYIKKYWLFFIIITQPVLDIIAYFTFNEKITIISFAVRSFYLLFIIIYTFLKSKDRKKYILYMLPFVIFSMLHVLNSYRLNGLEIFDDIRYLISVMQFPIITICLIDYLKDNTYLDKSFSHILSEKSNKDYINICDFKLPNMISTKQDYKLFNNKSYSIEQKIRENYADCFYILFKNIIQEVNNDKTFYFVKKDEQKSYEIQDIIIENNGYKKSIEFKDMPLEEYYALDFFLKNINIINKNNITEVISSFLDNEEHNIIAVLMGKEYGKKTFINLNRFLLEEEFNKNNNVNKILNKKNRL